MRARITLDLPSTTLGGAILIDADAETTTARGKTMPRATRFHLYSFTRFSKSGSRGRVMTDASLPAGRFTPGDFRVGQVFSRTWSVFSRNFLTFVLVSALATLPGLLMPQRTPGADPFRNLGVLAIGWLLMIVLWALVQAVLLNAAFQSMRGRRFDIAESARIGLRRFFPIVGIAIILMVLAGLGASLLLLMHLPVPVYIASLLVVFLMLYTVWFVATPVCVAEQLGPLDSMGRSAALTKGYRWKIFGMLLLLLIAQFIVVAAVVGAVAVAVTGGGFLASSDAMATTVGQVVKLAWNTIWTSFFATLIVVTYHDLRVAKEGIDTDQIAAVFD